MSLTHATTRNADSSTHCFSGIRFAARLVAAALALTTLGAHAAAKRHMLVISLDGLGSSYLNRADDLHLQVPTLRRFLRDGAYAHGVIGVLPTLTYPSHTTLMTGVWPVQHGVYANQKFDPTGALHGEAITEASTIKVKTLWQVAHDAGYTTGSVGFPVTTDATGIDWLFPANAAFEGGSEDGYSAGKGDPTRHYDHPAGLREAVAIDLTPEQKANLEQRRLAWTVSILRRYKPEFMTTHIGDLDHAEHTTGPFSAESLKTLEMLDGEVAMLIAEEKKIDPNAIIVIVSDHGFLPVEKTLHLNALLTEAGLQKPAAAGDPGTWQAAAWITGGSAGVFLKDPADAAVAAQVKALLAKAAANPDYGIARVITQTEARAMGGFPDSSFVVEMKPGFKLGAGRSGKILTDTPHTGTHGYFPDRPELQATFLIKGPGIAHGRALDTIDMRQIAPALARLLGVTLPSNGLPALNLKR